MSGIVGIYNLTQEPVDQNSLDAMVSSVLHRGPDKQKIWLDKNIGLGCVLLQTTPESLHEELPYFDHDEKVSIVADARIDNRHELLTVFGFDHKEAATISDSILVLNAYKKWGVRCCDHLLGDFAVVIWDKKEQRLLLVRDHFGIKPLYYFQSDKLFAFASEIKALLSLPQITSEINKEKIADFLLLQDDGRSTGFKGVYRVPAGKYLVYRNGKVKDYQYWKLEPGAILRLRDNREYCEAFREVFAEAVRSRMRRIGPLASHLSGGLDSSSITCMARELLQDEGNDEQLHTLSYYFETIKGCDEREYMNAVIQQGGIIPHFVPADLFPEKEEYEKTQRALEDISFAFNILPGWRINHAAHTLGLRVQLHGNNGDNAVSHGVGRLIELAHSFNWLKLVREAEGYARNFSIPRGKMSYYYMRHYSIFSSLINALSNAKKLVLNKQAPSSILNPHFAETIRAAERQQQLADQKIRLSRAEQFITIRELTAAYNHVGLGQLDKCAAQFSVEKRYPFWDKRLILFCLSLPSEQKLDGGWERLIMRRAMEPSLPAIVCWRKGKTNMSENANAICRKLIAWYNLLDKESYKKVGEYINVDKAHAILKSFKHDLTVEGSMHLYNILGLLLWITLAENNSGREG